MHRCVRHVHLAEARPWAAMENFVAAYRILDSVGTHAMNAPVATYSNVSAERVSGTPKHIELVKIAKVLCSPFPLDAVKNVLRLIDECKSSLDFRNFVGIISVCLGYISLSKQCDELFDFVDTTRSGGVRREAIVSAIGDDGPLSGAIRGLNGSIAPSVFTRKDILSCAVSLTLQKQV